MPFNAHETILRDRKQTSDEIKRLVQTYADDLDSIFIRQREKLLPVSSLSFNEYFDFVKHLRYRKDAVPVEKVGRPLWIMGEKSADCKKKAVMIASWLHLHNIPYRFIGSSRRPDKEIHHIFPQAFLDGQWINVDATYPEYKIAQAKYITAGEVL